MTHDLIRAERPADHDAVRALHVAAFDGDAAVSDLVDDLRHLDAAFPVVSLVAVDEKDTVKGHVMLSHAWLDTWERLLDVTVLTPLGVRPDVQGNGLGTRLIEAAMGEAERLGAPMVFLEGNDRYYGPRGFDPAVKFNIRRPSLRMPERAFQIRRLSGYSPEMTGTFVYHDVHWMHGVGLYR
ncbi:N-acetyltransferase [Marinovum sp.]|uniref:GNAT family N-acetyltransferase n=1 Tax=Marinovum sp. TaxID=2024839 RepID=UPI002B27AD5D|nr:N-acetyltransferase [Marinovum sp.]